MGEVGTAVRADINSGSQLNVSHRPTQCILGRPVLNLSSRSSPPVTSTAPPPKSKLQGFWLFDQHLLSFTSSALQHLTCIPPSNPLSLFITVALPSSPVPTHSVPSPRPTHATAKLYVLLPLAWNPFLETFCSSLQTSWFSSFLRGHPFCLRSRLFLYLISQCKAPLPSPVPFLDTPLFHVTAPLKQLPML